MKKKQWWKNKWFLIGIGIFSVVFLMSILRIPDGAIINKSDELPCFDQGCQLAVGNDFETAYDIPTKVQCEDIYHEREPYRDFDSCEPCNMSPGESTWNYNCEDV